MSPVRKILVASDLTAAADEAVRQADERARAMGATVVVLHVIPVPQQGDPLFATYNQRLALQLPELRQRIQEELRQRGATVCGHDHFEVLVEEGVPHAVIVQRAELLDVGLVVVGPPALAGLDRLLASSVSDQVLRHAHGPVLIARAHAKSGRIVVATDLSDPALPAVTAGAEEVRRTGARLTILHSINVIWPLSLYEGYGFGAATLAAAADLTDDLRRQANEQLEAVLRRVGVVGECDVTHGPAAQAILSAAQERDAELIVMGTIGRTGLKRALLGSVAESVARSAPCSVLVVRLHAQE